jgi:hypothetical protein
LPHAKPQPVTKAQLERAAVIWNTQSKHRALAWLRGQARKGRPHPLQNPSILRRENQLLTLSKCPRFDLMAELEKFAADIARI